MNLIFILFLSLGRIFGSDLLEDDPSDSPDIEIDNTIKDDYDDDFDKKKDFDPGFRGNFEESNKKEEVCSLDDNSEMCNCQRTCFPGYPTSITPCGCSTNNNNSPNSPPLLASQPTIPTFSSLFSSPNIPDCFSNPDHSLCACQRACVPGNPVNYNPCTCMAVDSSNDMNNGMSNLMNNAGSSVINNGFKSNMNEENNNAMTRGLNTEYNPGANFGVGFEGFQSGQNNAQPDFSNFLNPQPMMSQPLESQSMMSQPMISQPLISQAMVSQPVQSMVYSNPGDLPHLDQTSCRRACLPYVIQQENPCTCNFNMKMSTNSDQYGPSMYPTGYDSSLKNSYQDFSRPNLAAYKKMDEATPLNHHIPKVKRPLNSIGAYLGCFKDKKHPGRDLKMSVPVPKLTPEACINSCKQKKKRFAAVQNGYLCFCGSRFGRYNRTKDFRCGTPCTGDPKKYCGGHWMNAVYSTDGQLYNPIQFSFLTPDPVDELIHEAKIKKRVAKQKKIKAWEKKTF